MSIKLKLEGYEDLLKDIEKAGGSINKSVEKCMKVSAETVEAELKAEMLKANVPASLVNSMPPSSIEKEGNYTRAEVGYKKGSYNPKNLSDAYKVVYLNYGTPNRSQHGKIAPGGKINLGFIQRAKRKATKKVKKQQEETLKKILGELK